MICKEEILTALYGGLTETKNKIKFTFFNEFKSNYITFVFKKQWNTNYHEVEYGIYFNRGADYKLIQRYKALNIHDAFYWIEKQVGMNNLQLEKITMY